MVKRSVTLPQVLLAKEWGALVAVHMDEGGDGKKIRGTRPFNVMGSQPWTWGAAHLTLDGLTAQQSRCGANPQRYRDGRMRLDRPLPPGYDGSSPRPSPRLGLVAPITLTKTSPRIPDNSADRPLQWDTRIYDTAFETTAGVSYGAPPGKLEKAPRRHELSPRYRGDMGEILFGHPSAERVTHYSPRHQAPTSPRYANAPVVEPNVRGEERVKQLESSLRTERRITAAALADLETRMRWIPIDPRGLHDPDGQVFRRQFAS